MSVSGVEFGQVLLLVLIFQKWMDLRFQKWDGKTDLETRLSAISHRYRETKLFTLNLKVSVVL